MTGFPEFLIDGILPANEVHLLGGASGSGKTTFLFQVFLAEWQEGNPIFGHESHPVPYVYVSLDRSRSSVTRTLERIGVEDKITRVLCQEELSESSMSMRAVVAEGLKAFPDSKLIIIEGVQLLVGEKGNGYTPVAMSLKKAARICSEQLITIMGVCHAPKMKVDERFQHARESLIGSVSWGAYSDTIIVLNHDETSGVIAIDVLPRNAKSEKHEMQFGERGRLEPFVKSTKKDTVCRRIEALPAGRAVARNEILEWGQASGASVRTADDAIAACVKNKVLDTIGNGIYERSTRQPLKIAPSVDNIIEV